MRYRFADSFLWIYWTEKKKKLNSIRTWSSRNAEFSSKIASFLSVKFEHANYMFPIPNISFNFYDPEENWF